MDHDLSINEVLIMSRKSKITNQEEFEAILREKDEALHLRVSKNDSRNCSTCEHHYIKKNVDRCKVFFDNPIDFSEVCDAWNSCKMENTWNFLVHAIKKNLFVVIKEEARLVASGEYRLPVKSVDGTLAELFQEATLKEGCPDLVCNINPRGFKPGELKNWLDFRGIKYRELDMTITETGIKVDGNLQITEILSIMIDCAFNHYEEKRG